MKLFLIFDGTSSSGCCEEHGYYQTHWMRTSIMGVSGVLASVCPSCQKQDVEPPALALPDQSVVKLCARRPSRAPGKLRVKLPMLGLDALDLACSDDTEAMTLPEARGKRIAEQAFLMQEYDVGNVREVLLGIAHATLPPESMRNRIDVTLRFGSSNDHVLIRRLALNTGLSLTRTVLGLALFAWTKADEHKSTKDRG